ncbi:GGDEF domain-containing protein [Deinococcus taeanensis]|uniref:GGDEF domain-containing protein n=1 Tax=Deinococcus taeanensis TaxID=2737050 RepID=UPI001CDBE3F5|nr:GGDEF domain-containing protein [Deinococcus taeanensis]UBV42006.1 GGDEF domain-containing protein [Deinococcus taeanensis]
MPSALLQTESTTPHEQMFRRQALTAIVGISLATALLGLTVSFPLAWAPGIKMGLAFLVVKNIGFLLWLRAFPAQYPLLGALHFLILVGTSVYKFSQAVLGEHLAAPGGLGTYSYWLPLGYVVAFLVFPRRVALLCSAGVLTVLTGIVLLYVLTGGDETAVQRTNSTLLVQVLLTHVTFISFFVLFGVLQDRYVRVIAQAQSEARAGYLDLLTGVPNRRQLTVWLSGRLHSPLGTEELSVILFDIDHFKQVNDTHGHDYGDEVLRRTAAAVTGQLRRGTLFGRWGGEEFLVILPGAGAAEAQGVAERIRLGVAQVRYDRPLTVTVSLGVAQARAGDSLESLVKRADDALYGAKRAGRNQVQAA